MASLRRIAPWSRDLIGLVGETMADNVGPAVGFPTGGFAVGAGGVLFLGVVVDFARKFFFSSASANDRHGGDSFAEAFAAEQQDQPRDRYERAAVPSE